MKKLVLGFVLLLGCIGSVSAMDSPRTDSPRSPRPEQFLNTPFAQKLKDYGWSIAVVDEPLQKGMHLPLTPKRFKKLEYTSPPYLLKVNDTIRARTLTLSLGFDGALNMVTVLTPNSTEPGDCANWRLCVNGVDGALADKSLQINAGEPAIWDRIKTAIQLASYNPDYDDEQQDAAQCNSVLLGIAILLVVFTGCFN